MYETFLSMVTKSPRVPWQSYKFIYPARIKCVPGTVLSINVPSQECPQICKTAMTYFSFSCLAPSIPWNSFNLFLDCLQSYSRVTDKCISDLCIILWAVFHKGNIFSNLRLPINFQVILALDFYSLSPKPFSGWGVLTVCVLNIKTTKALKRSPSL